MSYRTQILEMLDKGYHYNMTCMEITKVFMNQSTKSSIYLSGSISSILHKLVEDEVLEYGSRKGPKGGYSYQLKQSQPKAHI